MIILFKRCYKQRLNTAIFFNAEAYEMLKAELSRNQKQQASNYRSSARTSPKDTFE
jgi:hypothetical protein